MLKTKRWAARLTAIAILFQGLLPISAFAAFADEKFGAIEICTGQGIVWLTPDGQRQTTAPNKNPMPSCPLCPVCPLCPAFALEHALAPPLATDKNIFVVSVLRLEASIDHAAKAPHEIKQRSRAPPVLS